MKTVTLLLLCVLAIIAATLFSSCAAGYSSEKGWNISTNVTTQDFKDVLGVDREDRKEGRNSPKFY